jgi:hypothetical protein
MAYSNVCIVFLIAHFGFFTTPGYETGYTARLNNLYTVCYTM